MSGDGVPPPGTVIHYAYLWADEEAAGREEAVKNRPALVLAVALHERNGETKVMVLAITHSPPKHPVEAVLFPPEEKRRLGLDDAPSWIVTTEANAFIWPGPDIRPLPTKPVGRIVYGQISTNLLRRVARSYLTNRQLGMGRLIERTK